MNITQKRKVLQRIQMLESDIEALKKARVEIASTGYASATLASGGGSKSYTHLDLTKITETISTLTSELNQLRNALATADGANQPIWKTTLVVYS